MKIVRRAAVLAASLAFAFSAPAFAASEYPLEPGGYVEVSMITIDDGHDLDYAKHLAGQWRRGQDYAKSQGWITGYEILSNSNRRSGEPDIYLVTRFAAFATKAEEDRRDEAYRAFMQRTDTQMQAESGERAKFRHLMGSQLLRELVWAK
jgi:hypothetical protein